MHQWPAPGRRKGLPCAPCSPRTSSSYAAPSSSAPSRCAAGHARAHFISTSEFAILIAADSPTRSLAICAQLREKELNLFNSNFSAVATQAALLAGFSMAFLEMSVHLHGVHFNPLAKGLLHLFSTICISANIFVVSIITFVSVWGSGKALRGKDGSMSMVVEGMNKERWLSTPRAQSVRTARALHVLFDH